VNKCPKNPRKQGCGRTPAPLFAGLYKLFRDLLIIVWIGEAKGTCNLSIMQVCHCEERSPRRSNLPSNGLKLLHEEIAWPAAGNDMMSSE